ncbi:hypothetical protein [Streptomyces finlayi]|uniref:hypothetical protein n=1 Tax=Streptomyces finlayi TaxID=67296 RepID=UPI0016773B4B|nr:hypothetical protein [Streptomyces finlayi]
MIKYVTAGLATGALLLTGGVAQADEDDPVRAEQARQHTAAAGQNLMREHADTAQRPGEAPVLLAPRRPGREVPIEVDFTANEDSKTAMLDVESS